MDVKYMVLNLLTFVKAIDKESAKSSVFIISTLNSSDGASIDEVIDAISHLLADGYVSYYTVESEEDETRVYLSDANSFSRYKKNRFSFFTATLYYVQLIAAVVGATSLFFSATTISVVCSSIIIVLALLQFLTGMRTVLWMLLSFIPIGIIVWLIFRGNLIETLSNVLCAYFAICNGLAALSNLSKARR